MFPAKDVDGVAKLSKTVIWGHNALPNVKRAFGNLDSLRNMCEKFG